VLVLVAVCAGVFGCGEGSSTRGASSVQPSAAPSTSATPAADSPSAQGRAVAEKISAMWISLRLAPSSAELSAAETECIASIAGTVDPEEITRLGPDGSEVQNRFFAGMFDTCLTDAHEEAYFVQDIASETEVGFTAEVAECMAPGFVRLVRAHGFADVFESPIPSAADDTELVRLQCGVIGPSRKYEAKYFAGLRNGDEELLRTGACPDAISATAIADLASRVKATASADRPTRLLLMSPPDASPEIWATTMSGQAVTVEVTTNLSNFACVMKVTSDPQTFEELLAP
jgi:hypothetical protein